MDADKQKLSANNSAPQGGIFSTPDLTVDAEKIAQANQLSQTAQSSQTTDPNTNQARVTSFFANTDATRQAQQPITSQPLEGDLVINNTPKKRSKLPIIIACLVVLAVGSIAAGVAISNERTDTVVVNIENARENFSQFAAYLLYGQENASLSSYDPFYEYAIMQYMEQNSNSDAFWSKLLGLFSAARHSYEQIPELSGEMAGIFEVYSRNLAFLNSYRQQNLETIEKVISGYTVSSREDVLTAVEDAYKNMNDDANIASQQYYGLVIEEYESMLNLLDLYEAHGCVEESAINDACVSSLISSSTNDSDVLITNAIENYNEASQRTMLFIDGILTSVIEDAIKDDAEYGVEAN